MDGQTFSHCRSLTNLEIVKMLMERPKGINHLRRTQTMVKYPCCGEEVLKSQVQTRRAGICLKCFNCSDHAESLEEKVLLTDPNHTICRTCFENLKQLSQENIEPQSLEFYLHTLLHKCSQCFKVIGFESELDLTNQNKQTEEKSCKECLSLEKELSIQSQINDNVNASKNSFTSNRSYSSILMKEFYDPLKQSTKPNKINKIQKIPNLKTTEFDRKIYESKDKNQLIDIIEQLSLKLRLFEGIETKLETKKNLDFITFQSKAKDIQRNVASRNAKQEGGLNDIIQSKVSNLSGQTGDSPFSKTKSEYKSLHDSIQRQSRNFNKLGQIKADDNNSLVGTERPNGNLLLAQNCYIPQSQNSHSDFIDPELTDSNLEDMKPNSRMSSSCVQKSISDVNEYQSQQSKSSLADRKRLTETAPCRRSLTESQYEQQNYPNFDKKNSHLS